MLFNSYPFILAFLPLTLLIYFSLTKKHVISLAKAWLVLASLLFYGWWNAEYLPLMIMSILFNFGIGTVLIQNRTGGQQVYRKYILQFGLLMNILLLAYYKYTDFLLDNLNMLFGTQFLLPNILLPLGISFFTITQITYLVDCYEGLVRERNFLNYLLFVTFFPHLLMGPILHHKQMMPQFDSLRAKIFQPQNMMAGIGLFTVGLCKKVLLADKFAIWANQGFAAAGSMTVLDAWIASLAYTFQLYFDFSGYTDMALGAAKMFNIALPLNFNTPYKARTVIEFWQRWHISLTNFITTYLYTPILKGMNKFSFANAMLATFLAMLIAGLWHQASWGYLLFYVLHALALIMNHWWKRRKKYKMPPVLAWLGTFLFVNFTLVLLRSPDIAGAFTIIKTMLGQGSFALGSYAGYTVANVVNGEIILFLVLGLLVSVCGKNSQELARQLKPNTISAAVIAGMLLAALLQLNQVSEFLYFKF